jgi:hypothetical protein
MTTQSFDSVLEELKQKYGGKEKNITVSFSLNLTELAILNAYAAVMGNASVSAALRSIIMDWFYSRSHMRQVSMNEHSTTETQTGI